MMAPLEGENKKLTRRDLLRMAAAAAVGVGTAAAVETFRSPELKLPTLEVPANVAAQFQKWHVRIDDSHAHDAQDPKIMLVIDRPVAIFKPGEEPEDKNNLTIGLANSDTKSVKIDMDTDDVIQDTDTGESTLVSTVFITVWQRGSKYGNTLSLTSDTAGTWDTVNIESNGVK